MIVTLNMSEENWIITDYDNNITKFVTHFGFTDKKLPIVFHNLNFGCRVIENNEVVFEVNYPQEGISYISTDQDYIESFLVQLDYDKEYSMYFWASNSGKLYEHTLNLGFITSGEIDPDIIYNPVIGDSTFEKFSEDPEEDNFEGRVYHNTTLNSLRIYNNGAWEDLFIAPNDNE